MYHRILPTLLFACAFTVAVGVARGEPPELIEDPSYETVVTPSRAEEIAFESPRAIHVVNERELRDNSPASTPQALENEIGVYMQRTNTASGAPILRGMLGQHVLLLVDGVRLNNSITRFGPNQLLNTIDPYQIQQVEVMLGPGSVLYGSDALGGVINLITRKPAFDPRRAWDASAELRAQFDSADKGLSSNLSLEGHVRGLGLRTGGSLKRFGELVGGRDTGLQRFTAYREGDADLSLAWALEPSSILRLSYAAVRQHDAPRTDRSTPLDFRRFTDQLRDLSMLSYSGNFDSRVVKQLDATVSFHLHRELRERFRLNLERIDREKDRVASLGAQVALQTSLPLNHLTYGVDLYHDWITSSAEQEVISPPTRTPVDRGRYVDGSRYLQLGVYAMDRISLTQKLRLDVGARFSSWDIRIPEDTSALSSIDAIGLTQSGVAGSLHGRYLLGDGLNLVAGVSNGFRAPNVDDFSALGCSGQGFDIPNADLDAEKSVTTEAGVKLDLFGMLTGSVLYYYTYLFDQIVRISEGTTLNCGTDSAGLPVAVDAYRRDNAKTGQIHGVELDVRLSLGRRWSLFSWTTWSRGQVTLDLPGSPSEPMSRVPPLNGLAGVRYHLKDKRGFAELALRWADRQDRLATADRGDLRICSDGPVGCDGTAGYAVLTLRGAARLSRPLRLTLSLENLTNETYRVHGSGVDGAGISAIVGMELVVK